MDAATRHPMRSTFTTLALSLLVAGCADEAGRDDAELNGTLDPSVSYRVVVSLESYAAGIDTEAYDQILALAGASDIHISPDVFDWGLEGEKNLCFALHGLFSSVTWK